MFSLLSQVASGALTTRDIVIIVGISVLALTVAILRYIYSGRANPLQFLVSVWLPGRLSFGQAVSVWRRCPDAHSFVVNFITAQEADLQLDTELMIRHVEAGGRLNTVVRALIAARSARIPLTWEQATKRDLAGFDVFQELLDHVERTNPQKRTRSTTRPLSEAERSKLASTLKRVPELRTGSIVSLYFRARAAGVPTSVLTILGMSMRNVDAAEIIANRIRLKEHEIDLALTALESHFLCGGNVTRACATLIACKAAAINAGWESISACDLAGRSPLNLTVALSPR